MQRVLIAVAIVLAGAAGYFFWSRQPQPLVPSGTGTSAGAGAGAGVGGVAGTTNGAGSSAPQEQVLPVEKARAASPLYEAHSSWPKADALPAFPEKPAKDVEEAALEAEHDVEQWFSKDLKWTRGVDGAQVYLKGTNAARSVTVLVGRNRVPEKYTLAFEAIFADAVPVDDANLLKRLKPVLGPELLTEIEKRGFKKSPAVDGTEDFAGVVMLGESGPGTVFPYFYCYARPKQVVGILQTVKSNWHPTPR